VEIFVRGVREVEKKGTMKSLSEIYLFGHLISLEI